MNSEREQFAAYFTARREVVRRTAYLLCGDWHHAEDLAQQAFVRLARAWPRVRDRAALDAYTHTCLVRIYIRENQRWFRRRERSTAELPATAADAGMADAVGRRLAVAAALRRLAPGQRAVLVARFYADLDVAATAEALGCSTGTVKSQTSRALRVMRELLDGFELPIEDEEACDAPARVV